MPVSQTVLPQGAVARAGARMRSSARRRVHGSAARSVPAGKLPSQVLHQANQQAGLEEKLLHPATAHNRVCEITIPAHPFNVVAITMRLVTLGAERCEVAPAALTDEELWIWVTW